MCTPLCLALLVASSAPQAASESSPPAEAPADDAAAPGPANDVDGEAPAPATVPDDGTEPAASPDSADDDHSAPTTSDEGIARPTASKVDEAAERPDDSAEPTEPIEPTDNPPASHADPTGGAAPPAPVAESTTQPPPPTDNATPDDTLQPLPAAGQDEGRAPTSRRPVDDDVLGDDPPVTSALAVSGQVATGVAACCCGLPLAGLIGGPFNLIPLAGPFIGPCVMQAGFCAMTAVVGGGAEVFVGDALGPGSGALLPVIGAQAVAHLAASLVGTVVGFGALGVAVGLALPNLPADPIQQVGYLYNDPGVLIAMGITSAIFIAAIAASLAVGPIAYALTAEPKKTKGFQMPRLVKAEQPPPPARVADVRF